MIYFGLLKPEALQNDLVIKPVLRLRVARVTVHDDVLVDCGASVSEPHLLYSMW